jgi:hypothetical protein
MRRALFVVLLALSGCFLRPRPADDAKPRCPDSDQAACTSGALQCTYDEKRACDLCKCKFEVI